MAEYGDAAESGASLDRAGLRQLLAETHKGKRCPFRAVLVDDLSRLSRDLGNTHTLVFSDLRMAAIAVIDVSTGMSTTTALVSSSVLRPWWQSCTWRV